jgi:hypothetical protein
MKEKIKENELTRPAHYGGEQNQFEPIKIIEALNLDFHIGNAIKYILRAGKKTKDPVQDLEKAIWYLSRKLENILKEREKEQK